VWCAVCGVRCVLCVTGHGADRGVCCGAQEKIEFERRYALVVSHPQWIEAPKHLILSNGSLHHQRRPYARPSLTPHTTRHDTT
jgi:hypothetical protein